MFGIEASALSLVGLGMLLLIGVSAAAESQVPEAFRTEDVKGEGGVTVYEPEKCFNGYTLLCRNRGSAFYLIDMEGRVVHTWEIERSSIHFGELLPNGHLFYSTADRTYERSRGVHELDWEGKLVWHYNCPVDHDHSRLPNGNSLMNCREEVIAPEIYFLYPDYRCCYSPFMIEVTPEKQVVWEWHGHEHIEELKRLVGIEFPRPEVDWAHCNTAQSIPENELGRRDPRFRAGNVMFSYRTLDTIGVIDRDTGEIVWAWGPGELDKQHQPNVLPSGHIIIFDNGTARKYSRILELDPATGEIVWEYVGDPPESFFSSAVSGQQRLPNGNTLICSGGQARVFEVTPDKEIVWEYILEYHHPQGGGGLYRHSGRYAPEYVEPLLKG
jgi:hypothetical protein